MKEEKDIKYLHITYMDTSPVLDPDGELVRSFDSAYRKLEISLKDKKDKILESYHLLKPLHREHKTFGNSLTGEKMTEREVGQKMMDMVRSQISEGHFFAIYIEFTNESNFRESANKEEASSLNHIFSDKKIRDVFPGFRKEQTGIKEQYNKLCEDLFGIGAESVKESIQKFSKQLSNGVEANPNLVIILDRSVTKSKQKKKQIQEAPVPIIGG